MSSPTHGHEFELALGDDEGQGSLACCSPWGQKESDTTEQLNSNKGIGNSRSESSAIHWKLCHLRQVI